MILEIVAPHTGGDPMSHTAVAAALGAVARWQLAVHRLPRPAATVLVNVSGALVLGLLDGWTARARKHGAGGLIWIKELGMEATPKELDAAIENINVDVWFTDKKVHS